LVDYTKLLLRRSRLENRTAFLDLRGFLPRLPDTDSGCTIQPVARQTSQVLSEENSRAYTFWCSLGFELVRTREPRRFGKKLQRVYVMRKKLIDIEEK
jgi:hypothetical protein